MNIPVSTGGVGGPKRLLNFGCGGTFHPDWTNLDTSPASPGVIAHDLRLRFPFADGSFDAAYGSHVLEHLEPAAAERLLQDCFRILKPGGTIRIAVPDLESIVRLYVSSLEGALKGDHESEMRYDWLMLELYDQVVRKVSGGNMAAYLAGKTNPDGLRFAAERVGCEAGQTTADRAPGFSNTFRALRRLRSIAYSIRRMAAIVCAFVFLGQRGASAVCEGLFRDGGEVHQWMYDRFSLVRLLRRQGFTDVRPISAFDSRIPRFEQFDLDVRDGRSGSRTRCSSREPRRESCPTQLVGPSFGGIHCDPSAQTSAGRCRYTDRHGGRASGRIVTNYARPYSVS